MHGCVCGSLRLYQDRGNQETVKHHSDRSGSKELLNTALIIMASHGGWPPFLPFRIGRQAVAEHRATPPNQQHTHCRYAEILADVPFLPVPEGLLLISGLGKLVRIQEACTGSQVYPTETSQPIFVGDLQP